MTDYIRRDFFVAGGTLRYDAPSYVARPADGELHHLVQAGTLCYVLTTRQMGKSSLMNRLGRQLQAEGIATALIDLTTVGTASLEEWYLSLLDDLQVQLGLETEAEVWWEDQKALSPVKRFTKFFRDVILEEIEAQVVVFIDEVDSALKLDFSDDFFAAIRAIYNQTLSGEAAGRLSFVLLGVATPNELIKSQHRTPFNVGERIELEELDLAEARTVFAQGLPVQERPIVDRVYYWTSGHPYLTQRVCQAIARDSRQQWSTADIDELVKRLFFNERALVEESNLQFVNGRVLSSPRQEHLLRLYQQIYKGKKPVKNDERDPVQAELKLYGLIKGEPEGHLAVRNHIYRRVFDKAWIRQHQVATWKRTAWIALILVTIVSVGLSIYLWQQAQRSQALLAETYISNFTTTENPTLRLDNLAQLIALGGYDEDALTLFTDLPAAAQVALFTNPSADLQPQIESVIATMYVTQAVATITADAESTQVLVAMLAALRGFDHLENPTLAPEIDSWLQGRTAVGQNDLPAAQLAYSVAISLNENNPATRYERALVALALPDDEAALADLAALLIYGEDWQSRVRIILSQYPRLYALITTDNSPFAELVAFVPTPTSPVDLPTPTEPTVSPSPEQAVAGVTAVSPTPIPLPTLTPTDTPILMPDVSAPLLSSRGQLAFIYAQILYVETEAGVGEYVAIGRDVTQAIWSPDGSKLLFDGLTETRNYNIWFANTHAQSNLKELVDSFPVAGELNTLMPPQVHWLPDNNRILFQGLLAHADPQQSISNVTLLDLNTNTFSLLTTSLQETMLIPLVTEELFLSLLECGTDCVQLSGVAYDFTVLWEYPNRTTNSLAIASNSRFFILVHENVEEIDVMTGEIQSIWEAGDDNGVAVSSKPYLSPDNYYIAFYVGTDEFDFGSQTLQIIDRNGRSYGTRANSQLLDWRPGGGPVVTQAVDNGQNQLVYWPLASAAAARTFVRPRDFRFVSGKWSGDGRYFIYNALDDNIGASYLYLWQPESGIPQLIHSAASTSSFDNFTWMSDGSRVYFSLGNQALWAYDVVTAELTLIAPTDGASTP